MLVCLCCDSPVARGVHSANLAVRVSLPLGGAEGDQGQSQVPGPGPQAPEGIQGGGPFCRELGCKHVWVKL